MAGRVRQAMWSWSSCRLVELSDHRTLIEDRLNKIKKLKID